jgi:hypothetical protein
VLLLLFSRFQCSGVHRALGVHLSKVRSTTLDKLDAYMLAYLQAVGNQLACRVWEAALMQDSSTPSTSTPGAASTPPRPRAQRPNAGSNAAMREMYIRGKYEIKSFLSPTRERNPDALNALLFHSIEHAQLAPLLESLAWGANPAWPNPAQESRTALHQAVMYGNTVHVECVIQFMPKGVLNQREARQWTALHYAAYQNDAALVELLLLRGGSQLACTSLQRTLRAHASGACGERYSLRSVLCCRCCVRVFQARLMPVATRRWHQRVRSARRRASSCRRTSSSCSWRLRRKCARDKSAVRVMMK